MNGKEAHMPDEKPLSGPLATFRRLSQKACAYRRFTGDEIVTLAHAADTAMDVLHEHIRSLTADLAAERQRIQDAPHDDCCDVEVGAFFGDASRPYPCNCWKADAAKEGM